MLALVPVFFAVLILLAPTAADAQTVYSFTNVGATGRFGPTQTQVNNAYSGTTLGGQVSINTQGVQEWVVPVMLAFCRFEVPACGPGVRCTVEPAPPAP